MVSRHFSFRGPVAAAFLKSFNPGHEIFGYAAEGVRPMPGITRQMLWESYLEDTSFRLINSTGIQDYHWDVVIILDHSHNTTASIPPAKTTFHLPLPALSVHEARAARRLRDTIKNEMFMLLRDLNPITVQKPV